MGVCIGDVTVTDSLLIGALRCQSLSAFESGVLRSQPRMNYFLECSLKMDVLFWWPPTFCSQLETSSFDDVQIALNAVAHAVVASKVWHKQTGKSIPNAILTDLLCNSN